MIKAMICIFKKITSDNYENGDIVKAGHFINSYPLDKLILNICPREAYEIDNIISDMSSEELKQFINDFREKSINDNNANVLIAYLKYCLEEKTAYEHSMRFVRSAEEKGASQFDHEIEVRRNEAVRNYAVKRASKVYM